MCTYFRVGLLRNLVPCACWHLRSKGAFCVQRALQELLPCAVAEGGGGTHAQDSTQHVCSQERERGERERDKQVADTRRAETFRMPQVWKMKGINCSARLTEIVRCSRPVMTPSIVNWPLVRHISVARRLSRQMCTRACSLGYTLRTSSKAIVGENQTGKREFRVA